jgi:hypothetical protein
MQGSQAVKALDRKLFREVARLRGQALTIAVVVASGVACYIALQSAWRALYQSRDLYYETNRFADVFAHLERAPKSVAGQIAELPGIANAYPRIVEQVRLPMDDLISPARGDPSTAWSFGRGATSNRDTTTRSWSTSLLPRPTGSSRATISPP